jgi:hypothetical protein
MQYVLSEFIGEFLDDIWNAAVFDHHFLMMSMALGGGACFDVLTELEIGLLLLSLVGREGQQSTFLPEESEIRIILTAAPVVV